MLRNHLEKLQHFVGAARCHSIRRYAQTNRLSQSAVSRSIQTLESQLGSELILRGQEGIQPTDAGRLLLEYGERILSEADELTAQLAVKPQRLAGRLTMGAYNSIAIYLAPALFKLIDALHVDLSVNLQTADSHALVNLLKSKRVDFILSVSPPKLSGYTNVELFKDSFSLYRARDYSTKLQCSRIFTVADASDDKGMTIKSVLESEKITERVCQSGDFETARQLVIQGAGYGILPERLAYPLVAEGKIVLDKQIRSLVSFGEHTIAFSYSSSRDGEPAIVWILAQVKAIFEGRFGPLQHY